MLFCRVYWHVRILSCIYLIFIRWLCGGCVTDDGEVFFWKRKQKPMRFSLFDLSLLSSIMQRFSCYVIRRWIDTSTPLMVYAERHSHTHRVHWAARGWWRSCIVRLAYLIIAYTTSRWIKYMWIGYPVHTEHEQAGKQTCVSVVLRQFLCIICVSARAISCDFINLYSVKLYRCHRLKMFSKIF